MEGARNHLASLKIAIIFLQLAFAVFVFVVLERSGGELERGVCVRGAASCSTSPGRDPPAFPGEGRSIAERARGGAELIQAGRAGLKVWSGRAREARPFWKSAVGCHLR